MEMLLEVASFDGSEKQCDILPAVSPTKVAELWPTFSIKHDSMELHNLVKCTSNLSGDVYLYPLTYQVGGRCSNEEKPVDRLLITQSVVKPSFQQDCGNMNPLTRHLAVVHLDCVCRLIMVCKELVQLPSVIDEKTVDQAFLDKLAFCLRFLKKLLGSLSKDVQSIENDGSLLQAVASFTDAFPKLFKVFVEKKKTKELFGGSSSSWINGLEAGGDDFVETVIRYILSDTMHVMTKRFHEMMVNMDKNAQLDAFRDALQNRSDITLEIFVALSKEGNMESLSLALVEGFLNLVQLSFGKGSVFQNVQACVSAFIVNNLDASIWRYDASSCNLLPPLAYTVSSQALFSTRLWKHESLDSTPGELQSRRHLNVRGKSASLPSITNKDWEDIKFGVDNQVDFYAVSFVYYRVVHELKNYLKTCSADISIKNLPSIISACDETMVACGDLGAELPIEEVSTRLVRHLHHVKETITYAFIKLATRLRTRTFFRSLCSLTASEDYTCITFHGPNPKTTHIFGNCILDCDPKEM